MVAGVPHWHRLEPTGTFVQGPDRPFLGFDLNERYTIASLRRVVHPSVGELVDRVVEVAASRSEASPTEPLSELVDAVRSLAAQRRDLLACRDPQVLIPLLGVAGQVLAPLQLIGPVPCVRLYQAHLTGMLAETIYGTSGTASTVAPETRIDATALDTHRSSLRYLDCLWPTDAPRWQTTPLVLISNAECRPEGYLDQGRSGCERLVRLLVELPQLDEGELHDLPVVPESHSDWGSALIVRASLR